MKLYDKPFEDAVFVDKDDDLIYKNQGNYGIYADLINKGFIAVDMRIITKENVDQHINWLLNIFKDGIYLEYVKGLVVQLNYADGIELKLLIEDYVSQLIFGKLVLALDDEITSDTLFFAEGTTTKYIGNYIDCIFIDKYIEYMKRNRMKMSVESIMHINVCINDVQETFKLFEPFEMYLNNTLCLEDTLELMHSDPEFNRTMHLDLSGYSLNDIPAIGMEAAEYQINTIKSADSDHCLKPFFLADECINKKQYKEVAAHVGPKPNGEGGIIAAMINSSYINGGLNNPLAYTIDASASRVAQILSHENVGKSGDFARILELNSMDSKLNLDPDYKCDTKNLITVTIKDQSILNLYNRRYYRYRPIIGDNMHEPDKVINSRTDKHLIGKTIQIYSPMTCASHARGDGICYRCYGDLSYFNANINIGIIAAELLSARYTQIQLSAKHLLQANIKQMSWSNPISEVLDIQFNTLKCYVNDDEGNDEDYDYSGMKLIINAADIELEDELDDIEYNAFINKFSIKLKEGGVTEYSAFSISNDDTEKVEQVSIYLSEELNTIIEGIIKRMPNYDENSDDIVIPFEKLIKLDQLFLFHIENNELSRIISGAKRILDKGSDTGKYTKDEILEAFVNINLSGGIALNSVHYELIISNQIKDPNDTLLAPDWSLPNPDYTIFTLRKSLFENPAPTISLQFQRIVQQIWKPLTYMKHKASMMDVFFMERPQDVIKTPGLVSSTKFKQYGIDTPRKEAVSFGNEDLKGKYKVER